MFKSAKGDFNGFLDEGSHLKGELHFEDTFRVSGKITGSVISSKGSLDVCASGEVDGEIRVHDVFVSGTVRGHLRATGRIEIDATGKVYAEIATPSLVIHEGAFFEGRCSMKVSSGSEGGERPKVAQMPR